MRPIPTTLARTLCFVAPVLIGGIGAIVAVLIAAWVAPGTRIRDEDIYLDDVSLFREHGLSVQSVRELTGPAGPLFQVVYWAASPLVGDRSPGVRFVSMALAISVIGAIAVSMKQLKIEHSRQRAWQFLSAPMVVVCGGLALTEMPALAFFSWHVPLILGIDAPAGRGRRLSLALGAGFLIGVATCGRQNFLLALPACGALVIAGGRRWALPAVLIVGVGSAILAILFVIWGGLIPPNAAWVSGLSVGHGLLAFAYAGITYCLFDIRWLSRHWPAWTVLLILGIAINAVGGVVDIVPLKANATMLLGKFVGPYSVVSSGLLVGCGLVFLAHLLQQLWANRSDPVLAYLIVFTGLLLASCARIAHQFSSRYVVLVVPALLLLAAVQDRSASTDNWGKLGRLIVGAALGLSSLCAYYFLN